MSVNITKLKLTPLYLLGQHQSHKNNPQGCVTTLMILHNRSTTRMMHNRLGLNFLKQPGNVAYLAFAMTVKISR